MPMGDNLPSADVLAAFGLVGTAEKVEGGQGNCYRVGDAVLKLGGGNLDEIEWIAGILKTIKQDGFRVPRQLHTAENLLVYRQWTAWEFIEGTPSSGSWKEVFAACDSFHRSLQEIGKPAFMDARRHKWAIADRKAWGELPLEYGDELGRLVESLSSMVESVALPEQIIHGDFGSGNVLFPEDSGAPYVIDFSPYYRPAGFAKAIVAVDAIAWYNADNSVLEYLRDEPEAHQLIVRATLRRVLEEGATGSACAYQPVIDYLAGRTRA